MSEPSLTIPFLPDVHVGGDLPTNTVRVAAWTATTPSGPSRRLALAGSDNTVWICTSSMVPATHLVPPDLNLPDGGFRLPPLAGKHPARPRAASTASSILSSSSRLKAFSPTASATAALAPSASISTVAASPAPSSSHQTRLSISDKTDLLENLLRQQDTDERSGLGLGLAGLTRRSLNIQSKDEIEMPVPTHGAAGVVEFPPPVSPSSGGSGHATPTTGGGRERTRSRLSGFWSRAEPETDALAKLDADEMEIEDQMKHEEREDAKEAGDFEAVKKAHQAVNTAPATPKTVNSAPFSEPRTPPPTGNDMNPVRIVLPEPGRGSIVDLALLEEIGELVVLRDVGLLDVLNLETLQLTTHVSLDHVVAPGTARTPLLAHSWLWRRVHLAAREEGALIVANGEPWPCPGPSPNGEVTRVAMLSLPRHECVATLELPGIGDVGVASAGEASYLLHATTTSLMSYPIVFPGSNPPSRSATPGPGSANSSSPTSPLLGPGGPPGTRRTGALASVRAVSAAAAAKGGDSGLAKFIASRRIPSRKASQPAPEAVGKPGVEEGTEVQRDGGGHWFSVRLHDNGQGVGLADNHVEAFEFDGKTLSVRGSINLEDKVKDVVFTSGWHDVCIVTDKAAALFARDGPIKPTSTWSLRKSYPAHATCVNGGILYEVEQFAAATVDLGTFERRIEATLCTPVAGDHICPHGANTVFAADGSGNVRKQSLSDYLQDIPVHSDVVTADRLESGVTYSTVVASDLAASGRFLVAGDEDGSVRIWDAGSMRLCGSWTLFDAAVRSATYIDKEAAGSLRDTLLCTSVRGSISLVSLRDMDELFLIPAARAPLTRIFVGGHNILIAYENAKARVWNVETREFRRSTGLDAADDMLQLGEWAEVRFQEPPKFDSPVTKVVGPTPENSDLGRLLQLDLRQLGRWLHTDLNDSPLPTLRGLLSVFLTFGINDAIDEVCTVNLGIKPPAAPSAIGLEGPCGTATVAYSSPATAWRVSPTATGLRQLAIVSLLRPFLDSPDHESWAADVIAFYTACLPGDALEADLELFAAFYLDSASDVHQAARMLFGARLSRMPNEDIEALVAAQQGLLPSVVAPEQRMSEASARALTMVGGMALHRFACMNPSALKAVAESLAMYLNDPKCTHVNLAIELTSKSFQTWQSYVDPMDMLRRLFYLATHKDASGANVAAQARLAVLHVASSNAPLFMSTLSMDILDAKTVQGRTSIMTLCVFMARKRPALLENGLPRICEAVVKSLDPNVGKMRDDVWEAATVILNELVQAFTTIDFHPGTQKLVVGTHEGAVIMYELKTASRLYVIEPHHGAVSAVAFSPDGRRLVTVSMDEGEVTVWKVGSSLTGFFNVGGPPRQGSERGAPYKRIPFVRPHRDANEDTGALSGALIQWRGNRQALVTIHETALNFETT